MKNVLIVFVMSAFGISTAFAQTPTAVPSKGEVKTAVKAAPATAKAEVKKATDATKTAVKAAPATAEVKKAADATKTAVKAAPATAKAEVKKVAEAPKAAVKAAPVAAQTAPAAAKSVKKATVAKATKMKAVPMAKMMYKCPKGDALCDASGKCPKCGAEMVAISGAKKTAKKK